ncbi:hypothetical protein SAMN02746065_107158 [Desulfocicer vacuolatum DSM 3385]|uniref:Uncharacterized protein n=1 Tax=Desulfocicer vacuolatum DSM 3385 TaxID=1121400 RepID=A0A1W2B9Q2_9BACT|nr:hypothetical protein SAMN02746065_107158 [Desulfocicer vacuolatum DSM 3385]
MERRMFSRRIIGAISRDGFLDYFSDWMWDEIFELFTHE